MSLPCNVNRCSTQVTTKSSTVSVPKTSTISSTITTTFHRTTPTSSSRTLPSSTTTSSSSSTTPMSSTTTPNSPSTTSSPSSTTPTSSTTTTTSDTTTLTSSTTTPTSSTTTPTLLTTTPTSPMTTPTSTMSTPSNNLFIFSPSCYLCNGVPPFLCERLATPLKCDTADQQFCINKLVNNRDGSRTLDRRCATEQECRQEWWERTSDRQQCTGYDPNSFTTTYFECSFCCTTPQCNKNIVPDDLYMTTAETGCCNFARMRLSNKPYVAVYCQIEIQLQDAAILERHVQVCFTSESFNNGGFLVYSSGCVSKQTCDTLSGLDGIVKHSTHAPVMTGNIIGKRKLNTCFRCCANEGDMYRPCNMNQCSMQVITVSTTRSFTKIPSISSTTMVASTTTTPTSTTTPTTLLKTTPTSGTTMPTSTTATPTSTTTMPTTTCYLCNGMPVYICEQFTTPLQCDTVDQQFCLNILVNNRDGSRTLDRRCVTEQECRQEWWEKTSDRSECSGYDPSSYTAKNFTCSYCCSSPQCNKNIVPDDLYVPSKMLYNSF
ncbi:mucin-2-like [Saccostrea echinata]|uniref:mucin-2-like n=1 Tax=Saccostrea echinata TaxID=191078 RepID=UPI002A833DA2|nr:mucin-2-like [Saccostrea echinata]